ncbi:DMT family transporter [Tsukamurella sp. 8F]|uniref:DMT family transporter n=1 Tax=unclassified Tsukamurella TaxID=2633480 RepID=UPI0023BA355C|nr:MULTISPECIES: DMT family transporter [unclassified Tsukamurella]MDF0532297.1 DMT family transporter [Tsukamurella sp. 8J]MDF0589000.1 DMT family transporter [Tsukamurella sp. 8F]
MTGGHVTSLALSIVLAVIAAFLFALGSAMQQNEAEQVTEGSSLMGELLRQPRWWLGIGGDVGGYVFQAAALGVGSVLVVQPLVVTTLLFALPISAVMNHARIGRTTWALAGVLAVALAVFLVAGNPTEGVGDKPGRIWLWPLVAVGIVAAIACIVGSTPRVQTPLRALSFGVAGGLLFAITTVLTKPLLVSYEERDFVPNTLRLFTDWRLYLLVACGLGAMYLQQRAFQLAPIASSLPAITVAEPVGAAVLGAVVLDESVTLTGARGFAVLVAVVATIASAIELARRTGAPVSERV